MDQTVSRQLGISTSTQLDAEQVRRERLVRRVYRVTYLFIAPFLSLLIIVMLPERNILTTFAFLNLAAVIPVTFFASKLIDFGRIEAGVIIYILFIFQVLAVNTTIIEGISAVLIPASMVLIVLSGMMLSPRHSYFFAAVAGTIYFVTKFIPRQSIPVFHDSGPWPRVYVTTLTIMAFIFSSVINQISISDLRKALRDATYKLFQANRRLEKASERKSQFTARTSHELRTPLSSIIAFTDLALRDAYGPINDRLRNALEHIHNGAKHLKTIINDILDLGKIEAGELEIDQSAFKIEKLVSNVSASIQSLVDEKDLEFSTNVSPQVPPIVVGDEGRINQILMNLTSNAVKFTEQGSVSIVVDRHNTKYWSIQVQDTGPGIPEDQSEAVFQAYRQIQRADGAKKVKGTGLGLAITRNLVELMGGWLEFESVVEEGTTFTVFLPLTVPEADPQAT